MRKEKLATLKFALLGGASVAVGALPPAYAQSVEPGEDVAQDTIVVTAQRRESNLQTTSASISAYPEELLENQSLENIEDIGLIDPSAQVAFYQGEAQVFLRGVGTPITVGGTDSATAIYRDGEFLSRAAASIPGFFDVQQVEILKGPQGTLYGRNATAGSVLITSKKPTEDWSGAITATAGNYSRTDIEAAISGPIVKDSLLFRLAAKKTKRDGYTESVDAQSNPIMPIVRDLEDQDEFFLKGTLEWRAAPDLTFSLTGDYYRADDSANTFALIDNSFGFAQPPFNPTGQPINTLGIPADNFGINNFVLLGQLAGTAISAERTRDDQFSNVDAFNKPIIWGVSGRMDWDIGDYNLSSVSAYRETRPRNLVDFDLTDSQVGQQTQFRAEDQWQFWQELQLSSPDDGRLQWIAGASFFIERNDVRNEYLIQSLPTLFDAAIGLGLFPPSVALPNDPNCCVFLLNGRLETEAYSVFVDGSYDVTDRLAFRAGVRYSIEDRGGDNILSTEAELNNPVLLGPPFSLVAPYEDETFDALTPTVGVDFQANDNVFVYASLTRGFKSGGFNVGSLQTAPFDQELTWAYEAGLRTTWLGGAARFNATGFYYDVSDLQVQTVVNNSIVVNNAAGAEVFGVEVDGAFDFLGGFTLDYAATWLDTEITEIDIEAAIDPTRLSVPSDPTLSGVIDDPATIPPTGAFNIVGNKLPKAPEIQFRVGLQYESELPNGLGSFLVRGDWSYQDDIFFNQFNDTGFDALPIDPLTQDSYHWLRARLSYRDPSDSWTVSVFADNITDEEVVTNAVYNGAVSGQLGVGSLAPPRTWGVSISKTF